MKQKDHKFSVCLLQPQSNGGLAWEDLQMTPKQKRGQNHIMEENRKNPPKFRK
jgi:hypothetical protein